MITIKAKQKAKHAARTAGKHAVHASKRLHHHVAVRPHKHLEQRWSWYAKWHQHPHHKHVHLGAAGMYAFVAAFFVFMNIPTVRAAANWAQSDWTGGVGTSTTNQYESALDIDTTGGNLQLSNGYTKGTFKGNELVGGSTNMNVATKTGIQYNTSQTYDNDGFSYDEGSPSRITVDEDGDYFAALTIPITSSATNDGSNREGLEAEIRVNGSKADVGVGRSSYIRNYSGHLESSIHLNVLLEDLSADDYIEVFVARTTDSTAYTHTGDFTMYVEQVPSAETIFSATATRTTSGTNLNSSAAELEWTESREDSGFTHDDGSSPQSIVIDDAGTYFVNVNVPITGTMQRGNVGGTVRLNGSQIDGGLFRQGYIRNANTHTESSIHWSGIVETTGSNDTLSIAVQQLAASGTITVGGEKATITVQELPSSGVYQAEATALSSGSNWNPSSKSTVAWSTDNIIDTDVFTHDTSSSNHEITVDQDGDYVLAFNLATSSNVQRAAPKVTVQVDGSDVLGAESKSGYIRAASGHNASSNVLLFPLNGLSADEVITVSVEAEGASGSVSNDTPAVVTIWQKGYASTGELTSAVFDAGYDADWGTLNYTASGGGSVQVRVRTDTSSDMSGATAFSSCVPVDDDDDMTGSNCVEDEHRYAQYQVTLISDGSTPVFEDIDLAYVASDQTAPDSNASNVAMFTSDGGSSVTSGAWTTSGEPYFTWDAAQDNAGGGGIAGYCLYLGQDDTADPVLTKGLLGTSPVETNDNCQFIIGDEEVDFSTSGFIDTALSSSNDEYYLVIKSIDVAGNVYEGATTTFEFKYDGTSPENPAFISAPSQFVADKEVTLTWDTEGGSAASDAHSGVAGLQYRIGADGTWYGDSHSGAENASDLLTNDGSYTTIDPIDFDELEQGNNIVYFRTWDAAGNTSEAYVTTVVKINTSSPSAPRNVTATPTTNTSNSFAFEWIAPSSFTGSASNLTYCYTINTLPTEQGCNYTAAGETSLDEDSYATQPGENTIYIAAKDEAGNINYDAYGYTSFSANTPAPGLPQNVEIADISVKQTSNWKIAMSWEEPEDVGAGVDDYKIYRSTNGSDYSVTATTSATSYVDQGLDQRTYYYKVKACDSANNCGAQTSSVNMLPTGRFTEPAELIAKPDTADISTRQATIEWVTGRTSDSKIAYGTKSGSYSAEEVSNSDQVKNHEISLTGLEPGVTYYYVAKWTDEDGNTGVSSERSFKTLPAPTVKNVEVRRTTLSSAIIDFTSENSTKVNVYYGLSENFGGFNEVNTSTSESDYTIELTGLDDGEIYFYKLNPIDVDGNEYQGTVLRFETPPRPRISDISIEKIKKSANGAHKVSWRTNVPTGSLVRYRTEGRAPVEVSNSKLIKDHEITLNNLEDDSEYSLVIESRDVGGNIAISDRQTFTTPLDTRPPKLTETLVETSIRGSGAGARGQIVVSWTSDEPSTSQVAYGQGSNGAFTSKTAEDSELVTEHVVIVSDLPTSSVYHVQPLSKDSSKNEGKGEDQSAIIGRANESVLTIIVSTLQRIFGL